MDSSGSIKDRPDGTRVDVDWLALLGFVTNVSTTLFSRVSDLQIGEVTFSNMAQVAFPLSSDRTSVLLGIQRTTYIGSTTNIAAGLRIGRGLYTRSNSQTRPTQNVFVLLTDGKATVDANLVDEEARKTRDVSTVYAVGIGNADYQELLMVTGDDKKVIQVDNFQDLEAQIENLVAGVCSGPGMFHVFCSFAVNARKH